MSVRTEADVALDNAKMHMGEAIKELTKIVIEEVWDSDYTHEYKEKLAHALFALVAEKHLICD